MKPSRPPTFERRRASELEAELFARARAWIPFWSLDNDEQDYGRALLKIAGRFGSVVTERLDRAGEKLRLGFLDWLAVPTEAARPSRLPVVFKLTDKAREAKPAAALTRLQVSAAGATVMLETETDVLVLPRQLKVLVGVDAGADAFFLPPPGLTSLAPLEPLPTQWQLKSFASDGATKLQLDPEQGLADDMLIQLGGLQYRVMKVNGNVVTVDPPLTSDQTEQSVVTKVTAFMPFDGAARNRQEHTLYIGHKDLFNIEAAATIEILGAEWPADVTWEFWSKGDPLFEDGWQPLEVADPEEQAIADGLVLRKPKGPMEMRALEKGGSESRWIRASAKTAEPGELLLVDTFGIRINCRHGASAPPNADPAAAPPAEAMANTTPLVLDTVSFPFGKEPRQFDAFYLGSKEVFSKKGADVTLTFEMADTTFTELTAVPLGEFAGKVLAGVARDGALHLLQVNELTGAIKKFRDREPLRPNPPGVNAEATGVRLDAQPQGRVPIWHEATDLNSFFVATTAGSTVWVWHEDFAQPTKSDWIELKGVPEGAATPDAKISDVVYFGDASEKLVALRGNQLSVRDWPNGDQWKPVATKTGGNSIALTAIVPVLSGAALTTKELDGMVGVSVGKDLLSVSSSGACTPLGPASNVVAAIRPVAVKHGTQLIVAFVQAAPRKLVTLYESDGAKEVTLAAPDNEVRGLGVTVSGTSLYFLAAARTSSGGYLASWVADGNALTPIEPFRGDVSAVAGTPVGAPVTVGKKIVIPGDGAALLTADFDLTSRIGLIAGVGQGIVTPASAPTLQPNDVVTLESGPLPPFERRLVTEAGTRSQGEVLYPLDQRFGDDTVGALYAFRAADPAFTGSAQADDHTLKLHHDDHVTLEGSLVDIAGVVHRVTHVAPTFPGRQATLDPGHGVTETVPYRVAIPLSGRAAPFMRLDGTNNNWQASVLDRATLMLPPGANPRTQRARAFSSDSSGRPLLVAMNHPWVVAPLSATPLVLDAAVGSWARALGDTSTNPELSWEYWNGTGWWRLGVTLDETLRLKTSGNLEFTVPQDLASTDWSGRTNYWIRARLIGGDYGREKVSVATSPPDDDGVTHQTVERSTKDIHAPSVMKLSISYEIREPVLPDFVMTRDSGSLRDQSDANRTSGATVEAFVPLASQLARLSGPATADVPADACRPECRCTGAIATDDDTVAPISSPSAPARESGTSTAAAEAAATSGAAASRALYLGFDAPLLGEPINVLLLVEERRHDEFAPMTVEALIGDRFVPVVVNDATRALGESGVLSMAFPIKPTPRELFGQTLSWLRLTPAAGPSSENWKPRVLGAYFNGVWASAAETLTRERLGSSQGEPNLTLFLARPPVLRNTLELRVREPLGEEERKALNDKSAGQVLSAVENLPGDWVLWKRVIDPADEEPTARVYALDEATGEIRFGDGRHGRIPPVGSDSIVAFTYRRSDAGVPESMATSESAARAPVIAVPGNTITARTSLNLVSPIEGVEAVFAADQGAGGAPPEDVDRVLRNGVAGLRHRGRALTARDVEDLVRQSSPDIAQARCFARSGFAQLIVVMRGVNPLPSAAQVREFHRMLVAEAPPALTARHALRIDGPALRRLRVDLKLCVASLEVAGAVARETRKRISALFDAATGGVDKEGWALGENPSGSDVAVAVANVAHLEGIATVDLREIAPDGSDQPWPQTLKRNELARLETDGVRIEFETIETLA